MNRAIIFGIVLVASSYQPGRVMAQSREVVGIVREAWTERPIANAEVSVIGEEGWVCTNARGEYRLAARPGGISVIARYGESISRPRTLSSAETVAALDVDPRHSIIPPELMQVGESSAVGGWVFARLFAAPEVEVSKGRFYVGGVELTVRPSQCGPSTPTRRGTGES